MWPYFLFHWGSKWSEESFFEFPPPHLPTHLPTLPSLPKLWTINEGTYLASAPPVVWKTCLPYISPASTSFCSHEITLSIPTEPLSSAYKHRPVSPILKAYTLLAPNSPSVSFHSSALWKSVCTPLLPSSLELTPVRLWSSPSLEWLLITSPGLWLNPSGQFLVLILLDLSAAFHVIPCLNYCKTFLNGLLAPAFAALGSIFYSAVRVFLFCF